MRFGRSGEQNRSFGHWSRQTTPTPNHPRKEFQMTRHKVVRNDFRLENGAAVDIEYWTGPTSVHVAAFDTDKHQISMAEYQATVTPAEDLTPERQKALIDSLANALEYALVRNPDLHLRQR
jgi:hypothetical protein